MVKRCKGDAGHQRMNYLYQAAHCTLAQNPGNTQLARFYIETMKNVAAKLVLRLDPHIKRTICKKCSSLLIPGVTATVRVKGRRQKHVVVTCLDCKQVKRFNTDEKHVLWAHKTEAIQDKS
ncbi:ribonuclease P protein subunit p21-like [Lytechinus pictus]|uniref:ribonuclease P protein subunit p21-like n=1 Tax=Lytechinus pictus TaxID=7653 RepID=UPI00240D7CD9|nr:ribonuclease P protein subunit p21-like [Lytechinus pictus]